MCVRPVQKRQGVLESVRKVDIGYERKIFQIYDGKIWDR